MLADLAPESAAAMVMKALCADALRTGTSDARTALVSAVAQIPREWIIAEICRTDYDDLSIEQVTVIIDALMRSRDSVTVQVVAPNVRDRYRARLHEWRQLFPAMGQQTASLWADLALLFGEVGHDDDAALIIELLKADRKRVIDRQEQRRAAVAAYLASNRTTTPPGPHDACSYVLIYQQALSGFTGDALVPVFMDLLHEDEQLGFAAHWLANHFQAPRGDTLGSGWHANKFEGLATSHSLGEIQ